MDYFSRRTTSFVLWVVTDMSPCGGRPTWHSQDMQRPLYMRPRDAVAYGLIDEVIQPNAAKVRTSWPTF